jgi:hypothetical protein
MTQAIQQIGNYRLERRIGKGGMSEVWLGRHRRLDDRRVAVKLLLSQDSEWIERFTQEARITSRLHHEHIIQIYDHGEQPPYHYTIMEYVAGGALRDALQGRRPLSPDLALRVFRAAGAALDYAHARGVIHRDVSPGNILLEPDTGRVLLTDFGIARESGRPSMTTVNQVMGTPGYLSPEHLTGSGAVTHLSDIYGLGVVLFEMLSGRLPWDHLPGIPGADGGQFVPPKSLRACGVEGLPLDFDRVIQTMLALDPAKRYGSVAAAIADMDELLKRHSKTTLIMPGTPASRSVPLPAQPAIPMESTPHPVETALGPDLLKGPLEDARKRMEALSDRRTVAALLDGWSARGLFRRRALGRQAYVHRALTANLYFYELTVLYETREPARTREEPDLKNSPPPNERVLDRWHVRLPPPKEFADDPGGVVPLPGSVRVIACDDCSGHGRTKCLACSGNGVIAAADAAAPGRAPARQRSGGAASIRPGGAAVGGAVTARPPTPALVTCPTCKGARGLTCGRCAGTGKLIERKEFAWNRRVGHLHGHDPLPDALAKSRGWLLKHCRQEEVYRERATGGFHPVWAQIGPLADLLQRAKEQAGADTSIALSEVSIRCMPVTEIIFDLGGRGVPDERAMPVAETESWYICGFENALPNDWRFLDWARVWVALLAALTVVLALLLVLALVLR